MIKHPKWLNRREGTSKCPIKWKSTKRRRSPFTAIQNYSFLKSFFHARVGILKEKKKTNLELPGYKVATISLILFSPAINGYNFSFVGSQSSPINLFYGNFFPSFRLYFVWVYRYERNAWMWIPARLKFLFSNWRTACVQVVCVFKPIWFPNICGANVCTYLQRVFFLRTEEREEMLSVSHINTLLTLIKGQKWTVPCSNRNKKKPKTPQVTMT